MEWFRHDLYAQQDIKIRKLILHYGYEGYGLYWSAMEMLYQNGGKMRKADLAELLENNASLLDSFVNYGLVCIDSDTVYSERVNREIAVDNENKKKRSEAGKKGSQTRWEKSQCDSNAIAMQSQSDSNAIAMHSTVQNSTEYITPLVSKDTIPPKGEIESKKFKKPTLEEVQAYCQSRNNNVDAQAFLDHYESNGWKVGKTAMKDWRAAVRTWEHNRSETKPKQRTNRMIEDIDERVRLNASIDPRTGERRI